MLTIGIGIAIPAAAPLGGDSTPGGASNVWLWEDGIGLLWEPGIFMLVE
jgi:hypothetical protein